MPLLEVRGLGKRYGGLDVLRGVDLSAEPGEVHAVTGANGAGKSTFMNVLAGAVMPSAGEIRLDGETVQLGSPRAAQDAGISVVYQELTVLPELSVAENIFLGREPRTRLGFLDRPALQRQATQLLLQHGLQLDAAAPAGDLGIANQQLVELARALSLDARILILDEPTAMLSLSERDRLFGVIRALKQKGLLVFFVSHRLEEVFEIADRVTVLRNGERIVTAPTAQLDRTALIRHMVGHDVVDRPAARASAGDTTSLGIRIDGAGASQTLSFARGRIVGFAGLVGSGRTRLARRICGLEVGVTVTLEVEGRAIAIRSARAAMAHGIVYLTEDRKRDGLFRELSVLHNTTAATLADFTRAGFVARGRERAAASRILQRLRLVARSLAMPVRALSGGNQQKVMFGRALLASPKLLVCDEPTRGVDVQAKEEIYETLTALAAAGVAVVVISSELKEVIGLAQRILVIRDATVVGELPAGTREEDILAAASAMPALARVPVGVQDEPAL